MTKDSCEDCAYFRLINVDKEIGKCRRFPPQVFVRQYNPENQPSSHMHNSELKTWWPIVNFYDWCGDFKKET